MRYWLANGGREMNFQEQTKPNRTLAEDCARSERPRSHSGWRSWHAAPTDTKCLSIARRAKVTPGMVAAVVWALYDHASQATERGDVSRFVFLPVNRERRVSATCRGDWYRPTRLALALCIHPVRQLGIVRQEG